MDTSLPRGVPGPGSAPYRGSNPIVEAFAALIEQHVQRGNPLRSKSRIQCYLCPFPSALPFRSLRASGFGCFDKAAPSIVSCADLYPALSHQGLHVAR